MTAFGSIAPSINDDAREVPTQTLPVGTYQIGPIDFDLLVDVYIWDTDFLIEAPTLAGLGPDARKAMDVADEVFGIAQGLPSHPDELKLTRGPSQAGRRSARRRQ